MSAQAKGFEAACAALRAGMRREETAVVAVGTAREMAQWVRGGEPLALIHVARGLLEDVEQMLDPDSLLFGQVREALGALPELAGVRRCFEGGFDA